MNTKDEVLDWLRQWFLELEWDAAYKDTIEYLENPDKPHYLLEGIQGLFVKFLDQDFHEPEKLMKVLSFLQDCYNTEKLADTLSGYSNRLIKVDKLYRLYDKFINIDPNVVGADIDAYFIFEGMKETHNSLFFY